MMLDILSLLGVGIAGIASGFDTEEKIDIQIRPFSEDGMWRAVEVCSGDAVDEVAALMDLDLFSWKELLIRGDRVVVLNRIGAPAAESAVVARLSSDGKVQVAFGKSGAIPDIEVRWALKRLVG
jgi:hypothetical protein